MSQSTVTITKPPSWPSAVVLAMIRGYQKYLSPRKGFVCAHRVLYRGESCSEHALRLVHEHGWWRAVQEMPKRFEACRAACQTLISESYVDRIHDESERKRRKLESLPDGEPAISDACWIASLGACPCDELVTISSCW